MMTDTTTADAESPGDARVPGGRRTMAALGVLAALAPFVAILIFGVPAWFPADAVLDTITPARSGVPNLFSRLLWSMVLVTGVVSLFNLRGWCGTWPALALLLAGLAIPQACIWMTAQSKYTMIGGLIPFSDASGYLDYACQMLGNHRIGTGFTDRPMFAALVSSILQFTGLNLQAVLAALLAFCGVGMFLAARAMHARFGNVAAICFLFVIYVFYNRSIGTLMTEHLGLGLSLYSFPLLLRGLLETRRGAWFAGLLFLSAALFARAGAFFILPALCLLTGRLFRNAGRFSFPMCGIAVALVLVAFGMNRLLLVRLFDPATRPQSNFSMVAYGVLRGTNWTDALGKYGMDHKKTRAATLELLREKPHRILHAMRRTWREFFLGAYGFEFMGLKWSRFLLISFALAFVLGVARGSRSPYDAFSVAVVLGILASIPFVPPADCDHMRAYAATMPLHACLAATGVSALFRIVSSALRKRRPIPWNLFNTGTALVGDSRVAVALGALVLFLAIFIPLTRSIISPEDPGLVGIGRKWESVQSYESSHEGVVELNEKRPNVFPKSLSLNLVSDHVGPTRFPDVRIGDFRARLGGFLFRKEADWLASLPPDVSLVYGGMLRVLVLPTGKLLRVGSKGEMETFVIGYLVVSCDTELRLSHSPAAAAPP